MKRIFATATIAVIPMTRLLGHLAVAAALISVASACASQPATGVTSSPPTSASTGPTAGAGSIPGCAPECLSGFTNPGLLPIGAFTTSHFLGGHLTVTFEDAWESHEDQPVEFSAAPVGKWDAHRVLFWSDILPVNPDGRIATGVPKTAAGFIDWLRNRPNLRVSSPQPATIGRAGLPATTVDIDIAPDAVNEDVGCPTKACVLPLTWPGARGNTYGIATPAVLRLYLCDVSYSATRHLLAVAVEGQDRADLLAFAPTGQRLIASAIAPVDAAS